MGTPDKALCEPERAAVATGVLGDRYGIAAEIRRRGRTLAGLSRELRLSDHAIEKSLKKPIPSADRALARWLGVSVHALWPDRYDDQGRRTPKRPGRRPKSTANGSVANHISSRRTARAAVEV